ncbi:hypothetical protein [Anabaena sp. PCC 7108]|nr:hypothetical protein [Anabaena sp. PCC 7108]
MFFINSFFTGKSRQDSIEKNSSSEESQEVMTLEDLVEILDKLDKYIQTT